MPDMITLKIGNKTYDIRDSRIGNLADLDTTAKNSLVSAINEVFAGRAPTDQQVQEAVDAWLEAHPEATTTVEDGSITKAKLVAALSSEITQNTEDVADLKSQIEQDESKLFDMTNLLESASSGFTENGITATLVDDVLSLNGTSTGGITKDGMFVSPRLKPNTTYAFRILNSSGLDNGASFSLRKGNDVIKAFGLSPGGTNGGTFTTPADITNHFWRFYMTSGNTYTNAVGSFILVESDTIPTQFMPPMQPLFLSADCLVNENEPLQ